MATFAKKVEIVDARQFKGTVKNAKEIVAWVNANGGEASWQYTQQVFHNGQKVEVKVSENILSIYVDVEERGKPIQELQYAKPGFWIIHKMTGEFMIKNEDEMAADYTQQ